MTPEMLVDVIEDPGFVRIINELRGNPAVRGVLMQLFYEPCSTEEEVDNLIEMIGVYFKSKIRKNGKSAPPKSIDN